MLNKGKDRVYSHSIWSVGCEALALAAREWRRPHLSSELLHKHIMLRTLHLSMPRLGRHRLITAQATYLFKALLEAAVGVQEAGNLLLWAMRHIEPDPIAGGADARVPAQKAVVVEHGVVCNRIFSHSCAAFHETGHPRAAAAAVSMQAAWALST